MCERKRERIDGRIKTKEEQAAQHVWAKKLKLAEAAVHIKEQQISETMKRKEIILFTNGPGGAD